MKFPHLAIGERFVFEGHTYRKTGPIAATDEASGQTRMIPRYARLSPVDGERKKAAEPPPSLRAAFDAYEQACCHLLNAHHVPVTERAELQAARDALLDLLGKVKS